MATWQFCQLPVLRSVARIACVPMAGGMSKMSRARSMLRQSVSSILATDQQGSIVLSDDHPKQYTVYGDDKQSVSRLRFTGQYCEMNVDVYLLGNGYRHYNPRLMRFGSPDSFSPFGAGGVNAYAYCGGDPVNRTDPSGHVPGSYSLYAGGGAASGKLKVISHGKRVAGPMASGYDAPANFVAPWNAQINFFTQNGFTAVVRNDPASVKSIPSFIKGDRPVVQSYPSGKRVGNYELRELVPNKGSAEPIKDYERAPFRMSVERMAKASGVDIALINNPIALSELLEELDASGHVYTSVDCLHCRGTIPSRRPSVFKNMYGAFLTQLDIRL
ncbi:hypothetical protein GE454_21845 [Pseudomonas soli]|nr:hypothetical protein [Pseudomonas soli]